LEDDVLRKIGEKENIEYSEHGAGDPTTATEMINT